MGHCLESKLILRGERQDLLLVEWFISAGSFELWLFIVLTWHPLPTWWYFPWSTDQCLGSFVLPLAAFSINCRDRKASQSAVLSMGIWIRPLGTCLPGNTSSQSWRKWKHVSFIDLCLMLVHNGSKCWKPPMMILLDLCCNDNYSLLGVSAMPEIVLKTADRQTDRQTEFCLKQHQAAPCWLSIVLYLGF